MSDVKERPAILNVQEVNAVLAGDKTQHRVIVENPSNGFKFDFNLFGSTTPAIGYMDNKFGLLTKREIHPNSNKFERGITPCPFGSIGDRLWVQEFHARTDRDMHFTKPHYYADGPLTLDLRHDAGLLIKYSAADMPRWASRILLEITDIRIERVQDTSHDDAVAEGVHHFDIGARLRDQPLSVAQIVFSRHWDTKHQDRDTDWESNPWVWVIEFKVVPNEQ